MVRLENDVFIAELSKLFLNARNKGAIVMTIKKYDGRTKPIPRDKSRPTQFAEPTCLIRATNTKKNKKISTVVQQKDSIRFQISYLALLKGSFDGLKKAKKTKKSKVV